MKAQDMLAKPAIRFVCDAAICVAVFMALVAIVGAATHAGAAYSGGVFSIGAQAAGLGQPLSGSGFAARITGVEGRLDVLATLAISFATLFALNLAFARHLRRAHIVVDRRRDTREG